MGAIWRVPPAVLREGKVLLDQQCWCWGQDVRRASGNLLREQGFVRERHPTEKDLSRYSAPPVRLWAFGLFYDGLWLLRQDFKARLAPSTDLPDLWTVREVPLHYPETPEEGERLRLLLSRACHWIAEYEASVELSWRAETVRRWNKKGFPASELSSRWSALGEALPRS